MDEVTQAIVPIDVYDVSTVEDDLLEEAGQAANRVAASGLFADYRNRRAPNTKDRQDDDLYLFAKYLAEARIIANEKDVIRDKAIALAGQAEAWQRITWGLVSGFVRWLERKGYAIGTINVRLTTIKVYAGLAKQAGKLSHDEYASMRLIRGYKHSEGLHVDSEREVTRLGPKKAEATSLTADQSHRLKNGQPNTPQGRRDAVLLCFLLDHGLRIGEVALLTRKSINMTAKTFLCKRPKVDIEQVHKLSDDTYKHLKDYLKYEKPTGQLLKGSRKGQDTLIEGMSVRAMKARVRFLGQVIGIPNLSPHDCRHAWATSAARGNTDVLALQEAGGWASLAMPRRYVERSKIANAGVKLA